MSAHTEGRLRVAQYSSEFPQLHALWTDDVLVARTCFAPASEANARRIVATWNACIGVSTEWLQAEKYIVLLGSPLADRFREREAERDELVAALRNLLDAHDSAFHASGRQRAHEAEEAARTVLAKYPVQP